MVCATANIAASASTYECLVLHPSLLIVVVVGADANDVDDDADADATVTNDDADDANFQDSPSSIHSVVTPDANWCSDDSYNPLAIHPLPTDTNTLFTMLGAELTV